MWLVSAWGMSGAIAILAFQHYVLENRLTDSHAYWVAAGAQNPYGLPPGETDAFLYSPPFAQILHLLDGVPWILFLWSWRLLVALTFAWLVAPLPLQWAAPLWLLCVPEMLLGNIVGPICVALVLSFRRAEAWAFPLLTKIVPGLLGLLYLAIGGQWRNCLRALAATALIAGVSWIIDPSLWAAWIEFLLGHGSADYGRVLRTLVGCALVTVGAILRRPWLLAPAIFVSTPVLEGVEPIAYLAAIPRLRQITPLK